MAYTYQNFASLGVNLNRQAYGSLDISQVFNSQADLNYYITKGTFKEGVSQYWLDTVPYPYAGQMLALVEELEVYFYGLKEKEDGTFETVSLGSAVKGDEVSIVKEEDGTLTLKGFKDAAEGAQPRKNADGEIEWVVPSTETVDGLRDAVSGIQEDITNIQKDLDAVEEVIGTEENGLIKDVADNKTAIESVENKIGTVTEGKTVVDMIADAQTAATYDDTELAGRVSTIEGDYLKGADKTELQGKIDAKVDATIVETLAERVSIAESDIDELQSKIEGLTGAMHFVGTSSVDPILNGAVVEGVESFAKGDVVLWEKKEYVYDGANWIELGDEGSYLTKETAASLYATIESVNTKVSELETKTNGKIISEINAYDTEVAGVKYETKSDASSKLSEAKTYTDDEIETLTTIIAETYETKEDAVSKNNAMDARVKTLENVGAEKNIIATANETQMSIIDRNLTIIDIDQAIISGLTNVAGNKATIKELLDSKVDKNGTDRLITETEAKKLEKLVISEDGSVEISGTVNAANVEGLDELLADKVDKVEGMGLSANNFTNEYKTKLDEIAEGAQVNTIEFIKVNGTVLEILEGKVVDIAVPVTSDAENQITIGEDKKMTVNSLNVDKLVQTPGTTIILNGGDSAGSVASTPEIE